MIPRRIAEESPKIKPGFLHRAVERKREEVAASRGRAPEAELRARVRDARAARPWASALRGEPTRVIAEFKRASPSAGPIAPGRDAAGIARRYEEAGAAAISVLTDRAFDGRLEDLEAASRAVSIPVLRKDFLVDPWQAWESRAAGADAVLLIVAALDDRALATLAETAAEAGLSLLVEVHDAREVERAGALDPPVVGVNARDLATLEIFPERGLAVLAELRRARGSGCILVAESGIRSAADVSRARAAGADAVLVGEHLMRWEDPFVALAELTAPASR